MSVTSSDIKLFKSAIGDSAGGGATATQVTGTSKNNFFADISDLERSSDGERFRKAFIGNDAATDSLLQPLLWFFPDVLGFEPTEIGYGIDSANDDTPDAGDLADVSAAAQIEVVSSAADTRVVTIVGIENGTLDQVIDQITLTGSTPVLGAKTFLHLNAVYASAEHGSNTITIRQGAAGTIRGTIPNNRIITFRWIQALDEASALKAPDLIAGGRMGVWIHQSWLAGAPAERPASPRLLVKEGS